MNSGPIIFLGLFAAMACSWLGFVLGPQLQLGAARPTTNIVIGASGKVYPTAIAGAANQGAMVYRSCGCAACHTQQVRPRQLGSDIARGWGIRRSTAEDYLYEEPVLLGSQHVGPDLANAGRRMDITAVLQHLYEPRSITPGSIMPSFPFLFEKRLIKGFPSTNALMLGQKDFAPPAGYEIVPNEDAMALARYVVSLHQDGYLYEAPPPPQPAGKPAPAGGTTTNSPAK